MAAKLIPASEPIDVKQIGCVLYGEPGARKTSLAQTGQNPITLAADPGIYRAYGKKDAMLFETWQDIATADLRGYNPVVIDTVATAMKYLSQALVEESPKMGNRQGGLSQAGYGQLATRFEFWVNSVKAGGADLVFICHEDMEKRSDETYHMPAVMGQKFYTELMRHSDVIGYMHFENGKRVIDFSPNDRFMAKCPPGWGEYIKRFATGNNRIELPDFGAEPQFLANLLAEAKASMGRVSAASAAVAKDVDKFVKWLDLKPDLAAFNAGLKTDLAALKNGAKRLAWHACLGYAKSQSWELDAKTKEFKAAPAKEVAKV